MLEQIAPLKTRCFCGQMKVNIFENFGVRHINWEQTKYGIYITKNSSSKKKKKTKYVRELKDSIEGNSFLLNKNKKKINMKIVILIVPWYYLLSFISKSRNIWAQILLFYCCNYQIIHTKKVATHYLYTSIFPIQKKY